MLIQGKMLSGNSDLTEAFEIRKNVFSDELHIPEEMEFDELDAISMHVIIYEDTDYRKAVATGRIYFDGTTCEIGHIAVLKDYRRRKYGDFATRMLLNKAFISGIRKIHCSTSKDSLDFFKSIGFHEINDETSNDIIKMTIMENDIITACNRKKTN